MRDDNRIKPSILQITLGKNSSFECGFECGPGRDFQWYYKVPQGEPIGKGTCLTFQKIESRQQGSYYCFGKYPRGKLHFLAKAELKVYGNFIIIVIISADMHLFIFIVIILV